MNFLICFVYSEDDDEYGRENFKWRRHGSRNGISSRRSKSFSTNYRVCGTLSHSQYLTDHQSKSYRNNRSTVSKPFKVIRRSLFCPSVSSSRKLGMNSDSGFLNVFGLS